MKQLFSRHTLIVLSACALIGAVLLILFRVITTDTPDWVTTTVEVGTVEEVVSVSGFIEAKNTAELAFPTVGRVTEVFVNEGQEVTTGEVLATQASTELVAKRNDASAQLRALEAEYKTVLAGATTEVRSTADTALQNAKQALARTVREEAEKVKNAKATLLSDGLQAFAKNVDEEAVAPTVSGTYLCNDEGVYTLELYSSNAVSGFSYRYTGIESGTTQVGVDQPSTLGSCGLMLQFEENQNYNNSIWTISVPNKSSAVYIQNKNAYSLALESEKNAVEAAEDAVTLAGKENNEVNANPRSEAVAQAQAKVDGARAQISAIDAQIADRSITAPFDGTVTTVDIIAGETSPTTPTITLLARDAFELKARVPEIDITKILKDQKISVVFDAQPETTHDGKVAYISLLATVVDGVAYFEATMVLDATPAWIKSGLNADIDIVIEQKQNVLRIPKRFLVDNTHVLLPDGRETKSQAIVVRTQGNNGFVEIEGLPAGTTIIAP